MPLLLGTTMLVINCPPCTGPIPLGISCSPAVLGAHQKGTELLLDAQNPNGCWLIHSTAVLTSYHAIVHIVKHISYQQGSRLERNSLFEILVYEQQSTCV